MAPRDRWSGLLVAVICLLGAALSPPPHESVVDGQIVREPVAFGYIIPTWMFFAVGVPLIGLMWWGVRFLYDKIWPEKPAPPAPTAADPKQTAGEYEEVYARQGGGFVMWKPTVPGTRSPMYYEPPVFTPETTAMEFLSATRPDPSRALIVGDDWNKEDFEFTFLQDKWIMIAPAESLQDLVTAAERIFLGEGGEDREDLTFILIRANQLRGIPTIEHVKALAVRIPHESIQEILLDDAMYGDPVDESAGSD